MEFKEMELLPQILKGLEEKSYKKATAIQAKAIPEILKGSDILGGAQTGTGKTAAFALPILDKLSRTKNISSTPRALILTPTRELADQVAQSFITYGKYLDLKILKIFGGAKMNPQKEALKSGVDIIVATPGRLIDHLEQKNIDLSKIKILVLDEADRMLDMGFSLNIKTINESLPYQRQNLLFSATYNNEVEKLGKAILNNPLIIEVTKRNAAADQVSQVVHYVDKKNRYNLLTHLIKEGMWYQVLVFVKTKEGAQRLNSQLLKEGFPTSTIHGDKSQGARTRALKEFKSGDLQVLVATDVAARGIDLHDLSHVVNYELPQIPEDYIHRIGRTGRAGRSGIAISLVSYSEKNQLKKIEKILKKEIPQSLVPGFEPKHDINLDLKKNKAKDFKSGSKGTKRDHQRTNNKMAENKKSGVKKSATNNKEKPVSRTKISTNNNVKSGTKRSKSSNSRKKK